jgi:hypothetical protein
MSELVEIATLEEVVMVVMDSSEENRAEMGGVDLRKMVQMKTMETQNNRRF